MADLNSRIFDIGKGASMQGQLMLAFLAAIDPFAITSPYAQHTAKAAQREKEKEENFRDSLEQLSRTREKMLRELNERLDKAMENALADRADLEEEIRLTDEAAPKIDGVPYFRTRDHRKAFTRDGKEATPEQFRSLQGRWPKEGEKYYDIGIADQNQRRIESDATIAKIDATRSHANDAKTSDDELEALLRQDAEKRASTLSGHTRSGLTANSIAEPFQASHDNWDSGQQTVDPTRTIPSTAPSL